MSDSNSLKLVLLIKQVTTKTLVSGDKSARIVLETLYPEDVSKLAVLSDKTEVEVEIKYNG